MLILDEQTVCIKKQYKIKSIKIKQMVNVKQIITYILSIQNKFHKLFFALFSMESSSNHLCDTNCVYFMLSKCTGIIPQRFFCQGDALNYCLTTPLPPPPPPKKICQDS